MSPGDTVGLDTSGGRVARQLLQLTPTTIALLTEGGRPEFGDDYVLRVERRERRPGRSFLVGAFWGTVAPLIPLVFEGALGGADNFNLGHGQDYLRSVGPVIPTTAAIGAVVGLIRGSRLKSRPVYERPKP